MTGASPGSAAGELRTFVLLVTGSFNMAATMNFVDPLRVANYLFGRRYAWSFQARKAGEVPASNGARLLVDALNPDGPPPDYLVISTSWAPEDMASADVLTTVRKWSRRGTRLVGLDTGAFVLGQAGVLTPGCAATVHPEHRQALAELYPDITVSDAAFVDGRVALTCAGGVAAVACGLSLIEADWGRFARQRVAAYLLDPSEASSARHAGEAVFPSLFAQAETLMDEHLEDVITLPQLCAALGVTQRKMERVFRRQSGLTPVAYYLSLRLEKARELLVQTEMPVMEVALACGFSSPENFSRRYRLHHGYAPREHRLVGRVAYEFRFAKQHT